MHIGLLSDTHIPYATEKLPSEVKSAFDGVDLILHAGDIFDLAVLDELEHIAPVLAARGDDDDWPEIDNDHRVKEKHILSFGDQTLWLVHTPSYWLLKEINELIESQPQDSADIPTIVVHGHQHRPSIKSDNNGILFVNSGSPTLLEYRKGLLGTVAILTIDTNGADTHIIQL